MKSGLSDITSPVDPLPSTSSPLSIRVPDGVCMALVKDIVIGHVWDSSKRSRKTPPRPMNKFILYRSYFVRDKYGRLEGKGQRNASKEAGLVWNGMSDKDKDFWDALARNIDARHKARFPEYKFNPRRKEDIKRRGRKDKQASASKQRPGKVSVYESPSPSFSGLSPPSSSDSDFSSSQNTPVWAMSSIPLPSVSGAAQYPVNSDPYQQWDIQTQYHPATFSPTHSGREQPPQNVQHTHMEYPSSTSCVSTADMMCIDPPMHTDIGFDPMFPHHARPTRNISPDNVDLPFVDTYSSKPMEPSSFIAPPYYPHTMVQAAPIALPPTSRFSNLCMVTEAFHGPIPAPDANLQIQQTHNDCVPPFASEQSIAVTPYQAIDMATSIPSSDCTSFPSLHTFLDSATVESACGDSPSLCWSESNYDNCILNTLDYVQFGFY